MLFHDNEGNILIQDRKNIKKEGSRDYGFFGGGIKKEESPEQALIREIVEELGVDISSSFKFFKKHKEFREDLDKILELDVFLSSIPLNYECTEGKPFLTTLDEALNLNISQTDKRILEEIKSYLDSR